MIIRSHIRQLPPSSFRLGYCTVCEAKVVLKFTDQSTGQCIGACCVDGLLSAEKALAHVAGLRNPREGETIPNN